MKRIFLAIILILCFASSSWAFLYPYHDLTKAGLDAEWQAMLNTRAAQQEAEQAKFSYKFWKFLKRIGPVEDPMLLITAFANQTYYIDCSCTNNGNGALNSGNCAATPGGAGPYNSISNFEIATDPTLQEDVAIRKFVAGGDDETCTGTASLNIGDSDWEGTSENRIYVRCYEGTTAEDWCEAGEFAIIDHEADWVDCTSNRALNVMRDYVTIQGIHFKNICTAPVWLYGDDWITAGTDADDAIITECKFEKCGVQAIYDLGTSATSEAPEPYPRNGADRLEVSYTEISGWSQLMIYPVCRQKWGAAAMSNNADGAYFHHNYVHNGKGEGLNCHHSTTNCVIEENFVFNTASFSIYMNGTGPNRARYNLSVCGDDVSPIDTYHFDGQCSAKGEPNSWEDERTWAWGIAIEQEGDYPGEYTDMSNVSVEYNIVAGCKWGFMFGTSKNKNATGVTFANNMAQDNRHNYDVRYLCPEDETITNIVYKNNISSYYTTLNNTTEITVEAHSTCTVNEVTDAQWDVDYNLWKNNPPSGSYDATDWIGGNEQYGDAEIGDETPNGSDWQSITATDQFTTADLYIQASSSKVINKGVDLGDTADCDDSDKACGMSFATGTLTNFHTLPDADNIYLTAQDPAWEIGPWVYEPPDVGADEVEMAGGASFGGGAGLGGN